MKKRPKIVSTLAVPMKNSQVLFLEKDSKDEVYCTIYEEDCHMTQREIAKAIGYTEPAVTQIIKKSLAKIFRSVRNKNKSLNPIELTALIGQILNVKTDVQFQRYLRSLPNEIRIEVSKYAEENYH